MELRDLGRTGLRVSKLAFGASPLGGEFGAIDEAEGRRAVRHAIDRGINFFDTAPYYGRTRSETVLGAALDGVRDRVVLATKVGRYGKADFDFSPRTVLEGLDASLKRLRTDYVDVLYIHDIEFGDLNAILNETLPALEQARAAGKVRAIGVSGLPLAILCAAVEGATLDVVLSYCHWHLADASLEADLAPTALARGTALINAAPLAMGLLTMQGPPDWHPAPEAMKLASRKAAEACARRGVDLAEIALRYGVEAPSVASTVVGMASVAEVDRNLAALGRPVDAESVAEVDAILAPVRGMTWPSGIAPAGSQ